MASLTYAMPMVVTFVSDMERSRTFYKEVLGFHEAMPSEHFTVMTIPGGMTFALHTGGSEREPGPANSVPVFSVENIKKARQQLEGDGIRVLGEPREVPGGLTLDIADPDGNIVQLIQRTI